MTQQVALNRTDNRFRGVSGVVDGVAEELFIKQGKKLSGLGEQLLEKFALFFRHEAKDSAESTMTTNPRATSDEGTTETSSSVPVAERAA